MGDWLDDVGERSFAAKTRRKWTARMSFSEETNQKTSKSERAAPLRPWLAMWKRRRNKSLLLLFFRKEDFYLFHKKPLRG
jgi:hypothetical protein